MQFQLKWLFMLCLSLTAFCVCGAMGYVTYMWKADVTHLGAMALVVYLGFTLWTGWLTREATSATRYTLDDVRAHAKSCWFAAEVLLGIGMIGTMVGMLIMLNTAFGPEVTSPAQAMNGLRAGLSTVGLTTVIGLVCSFALKAQLVNLEYLTDA